MIEVVGGRVTEDQRLDNNRDDENYPDGGVLQNRQDFLAEQEGDSAKRTRNGFEQSHHRSNVFLVRRRAPVMSTANCTIRIVQSRTIRLRLSPARKLMRASST